MNTPFVFLERDFPNHATHCNQAECGFSVRRNILIQWDEDRDLRILFVIDGLPQFLCDQIVLMQEHEGGLSILWKPNGLDYYQSWVGSTGISSSGVMYKPQDVEVCGDAWVLEHTSASEGGALQFSL
jgi:hypothetical protein